MRGLSPVAASRGHSLSRCAGLSLSRPLLLRSTGSRRAGSVVVAHGTNCSAARGIFPDQDLNPCPPALADRFSTTAPPGKPYPFLFKNSISGTSLAVQWLRLHTSNAGGVGSIPGGGAKIPHALRPKNQNIK